jgi:hypothetical protein
VRSLLRRAALALGVLALCLLSSAPAQADQLENPRPDFTAYTRPKGEVAASLFKVELGIIDELMIGTYVPTWFLFPLLKAPVPTFYVKGRSWFEGPFTLALRGGFTFVPGRAVAQIADGPADASMIALAGEIDASYRFDERFTLSLGIDSSQIHAAGSGGEATSVEGASTSDTLSTRLFGEWRFTRVFALTLLAQVLIYQSPISVDASSDSDAVSVEGDLSAESALRQRRLSLIAGVSFSWKRWDLYAGVGYGVFYLPVLGLPTTKAWPLVDLGFAYRFDLY